ncbi:glycosyltransferase [Acidobacterium sp. S8]|uniref:glycosyltransferase n=1 Tax=Acidobacterium sp. S8 TaxID=1641854 RepID=UPI00131EA0A1|nr:glycosyltransferase [Acidobacterium sp. S8]
MRTLFYNHTGIVSGAEKMLLLSLANLPRGSFELILVCPAEGTLRNDAADLGVPVITCNQIRARFTYNPLLFLNYLLSIAGVLYAFRKKVKALSPDIVQANTVRAGIVATVATIGTRVPVIWHSHDILPSHPLTTLIRLLAHSSRRVHIVACSKAAAYTLRPFTSRGRHVVVIHNGIDMTRFHRSPELRDEKRKELVIVPKSFVIGMVGQVSPRKGQLGLIRAFADVRSTVPEAVLLIIGASLFNKDHEYLQRLEQEVAKLQLGKSVRFLGQRSDVPALIQTMDLFVLNSEVEPFALVLIEAMMLGKAVIATDCGGPAEIVHHRVDGEILPVGDHKALVNTMIRLAMDPSLRERYGEVAIRNVKHIFSKERYIAQWCSQYRKVTSAHLSKPLEIVNDDIEMGARVSE